MGRFHRERRQVRGREALVRYLLSWSAMTFARASEASMQVDTVDGAEIRWYASNVPRLRARDGLRCILFEGAHQNTHVDAEALDGASTTSEGTVTAGVGGDPDGGSDADRFAGGGSAPDRIYSVLSGTGIASAFLRGAAGNTRAHLRAVGSSTAGSDRTISSQWSRQSIASVNGSAFVLLPDHTLGASDGSIATTRAMDVWGRNNDPDRSYLLSYIRSVATQAEDSAVFAPAVVPAMLHSTRFGLSVWMRRPSSFGPASNGWIYYDNNNYVGAVNANVRVRVGGVSYEVAHTWTADQRIDLQVDWAASKARSRVAGGAWSNHASLVGSWAGVAAGNLTLGLIGAGSRMYGDISLPYEVPAW